MSVVLTFRNNDETQVVGSYDDHDKAIEGATQFLKELNTDEEALADDLGEDWTWEQAIEKWSELTDGYEEFSFKDFK